MLAMNRQTRVNKGIYCILLLIVVFCTVTNASSPQQYGSYNPNSPYGAGNNPGNNNFPYNRYNPPPNVAQYNPQDNQNYQQNYNRANLQQPQQQSSEGGFFSKIKSSIVAASNALANSFDTPNQAPEQLQLGYGNRPPSNYPPRYEYGNNPASAGQQAYNPPPSTFHRPPPGSLPPPPGSSFNSRYNPPPPANEQEGGLLGKLKNLFGSEEQSASSMSPGPSPGAFSRPPPPPGFRMPQSPPPPGLSSAQQPPFDRYGGRPQKPFGPPGSQPPQGNQPVQQQQQQAQQQQQQPHAFHTGHQQAYQPSPHAQQHDIKHPSQLFPGSNKPDELHDSQRAPAFQPPRREDNSMSGSELPAPMPPSRYFREPEMSDQQLPGQYNQYPANQPHPLHPAQPLSQLQAQPQVEEILSVEAEDPLAQISPEPQVFVHGDNIVFILKPKEFHRKKMEMEAAGPNSWQVFADFEHVITQSKNTDGTRVLGSAELLESSGAISETAMKLLQQLAEEFDGSSNFNQDLDDHAAFELLTSKSQQIIASKGNLNIADIPAATRSLLHRMALRDGWRDALQYLSASKVPTYLFSSGYGDVLATILILNNILSSSSAGRLTGSPSSNVDELLASAGAQSLLLLLPPNIRVIANFCRAAPDGSVRAFSNPIVHERNKNATTAARFMGMPLPARPYALVLGSHEDDVFMTEGLEELKDQLSIGYLDVTEDLPQRLPTYLSAFDAVVVGDSSFAYVKSLLEDLLHLPKQPVSASRAESDHRQQGVTGGLLGLRRGLGMLLNQGQQQPSPQQQQQQSNPQHAPHQHQHHGPMPANAMPSYPSNPHNPPQHFTGRQYGDFGDF